MKIKKSRIKEIIREELQKLHENMRTSIEVSLVFTPRKTLDYKATSKNLYKQFRSRKIPLKWFIEATDTYQGYVFKNQKQIKQLVNALMKEIGSISEGKLNEGLKRFKVYVSGEKEPLILLGKNEKEVKQTAYAMIKNSSVKVRKVIKEFDAKMQKNHFLNLVKQEIESLKGQIAYAKDKVNYKGTPDWEKKEFKGVLKDLLKKLKDSEKHYKRVQKLKEGKLNETWDGPQGWSSKEAKEVVDGALKNYAKELRKVQYKVVKDWMSKAKGGVIDFFDIQRGLTTGDISRAHPYETSFLQKVLTRDKIISRFRSYFGGKKGFEKRRKNQRGM